MIVTKKKTGRAARVREHAACTKEHPLVMVGTTNLEILLCSCSSVRVQILGVVYQYQQQT